ncbi:MAG: exodeoxyribonuclease III [Pseudobdellovibrionaceae bacterium]|nr:MAG: exodeoxyribonuclease III [Pseudobdellovibrionaceae bacterium]
MRIVSWNVNGIRACAKKGFHEFIEAHNPDLFCIQETKAHRKQTEKELWSPGGRCSFWSAAARRGYSGVATYLKSEPESVSRGIGIPKFDDEGRIVVTKQHGFLLYNVYFPNGGSGVERHMFKQEFLQKFLVHLKTQINRGHEIVLCGDYNVAHRDIDVYDPEGLSQESGFLPEERKWFDDFLAAGFVDTFRKLHPDEKDRYTWWSYREKARIGNRGWRIDYVSVTKGLSNKIKRAEILDDQTGSDHCPVLLELDIKGG